MSRKILLVEADYKNKYPPLGLMKISTYHKDLGDEVYFVKGKDAFYKNIRWDRIYITTLFTFYWKKTIDVIKYYQNSTHDLHEVKIGGVMASIMSQQIEDEIGIKPIEGLLNSSKEQLGDKEDIDIDELTPDYDILDEIDYEYPTANSYIGYMTRGCVRKCKFCAVPQLEPKYNEYLSFEDKMKDIDKKFGEKRDLLLMDNNVLGSDSFPKIIEEIKSFGFKKGARYQEPNLYEFYINRIKSSDKIDNIGIYKLQSIITKEYKRLKARKKLKKQDEIVNLFESNSLINDLGTFNNFRGLDQETRLYYKKLFIDSYEYLGDIIEKYRNKSYKQRYIDFNQGIDARLLNEKNMKLLSGVNIKPLRIAFDNISLKDIYSEKVRMAAKYGMKYLSNYILYNYNDTPEELYERLKINIELNQKYNLKIYSFPMKYIPMEDINRKHVSKKWTKKQLRAVQVITNAVHGSVMPGREYFETAFGSNVSEFMEILNLPEKYILKRNASKISGDLQRWRDDISVLRQANNSLYDETLKIIHENNFKNIDLDLFSDMQKKVLTHYI